MRAVAAGPSGRFRTGIGLAVAAGAALVTGPLVAASGGLRLAGVIALSSAIAIAGLGTAASGRIALALIFVLGFVRRVTSGPSAYVESDPLILLPLLLLAGSLLTVPQPALRPPQKALFGLFALLCLNALVSAASGAFTNALYALATSGIPLLLAVQSDSRQVASLIQFAARWIPAIAAVTAVYAVVQWLAPLPWDLAWLTTVQESFDSVGEPEAGDFRIFSTTESPGVYGVLLGISAVMTTSLLLEGDRSVRQRLALLAPLALLAFAISLTQVRTAVLGLLCALPVVVLVGRRERRGRALLGITALMATLLIVPTFVARDDRSAQRYSILSLTEDESFQARADLWPAFIGALTGNPLGQGLGRTGAAAGLGDGSLIVDNGYIARTIETGPLGLFCFIATVTVALLPVTRRLRAGRLRRSDRLWLGVVVFFLAYEFSGPLIGTTAGSFFWLALAALCRDGEPIVEVVRERRRVMPGRTP